MEESEDDSMGQDSFTSDTVRQTMSSKSRTCIRPEKGHNKGFQLQELYDDEDFISFKCRKEYEYSSSSKCQHPEIRKSSKKATIHGSLDCQGDESEEKPKVLVEGVPTNDKAVFPSSEIVISDCWRMPSGENLVKYVELFKDNNLDEEDLDDVPSRLRIYDDDEFEKSPPCTQEFHMLTEVQRARILAIVEDSIKKIANEDYLHTSCGQSEKQSAELCRRASVERFICRKFLLPWVIMKIIEMLLCHVIQLIFISRELSAVRQNDIIPVVVTYYLTLFIILVSLVVHVGCFSYTGVQNPCYFMGVISSSVLTLTTTLGILIMLISMYYYKTFTEILVLVFVVVLLCLLFMELCLCYIEVKSVWSKIGSCEQHYVT